MIPDVRVRDFGHYNSTTALSVEVDENPEALLFKETFEAALSARVCGDCGYAELYVANPRELYAAHERSKQSRSGTPHEIREEPES